VRPTAPEQLPVPAYQLFSSTELLGRDGAGTDAGGGSTRRYPVALEPVGLLAADLSGLKLVALMIDGVHFADICVWLPRHRHRRHQTSVGGGTGVDREHHRGSLPADRVRERGLDTTRPTLAVLDGAKALAAAVGEVFDHPVIQRCQLHKIRNVGDYLPKNLQAGVERRMRTTYHAESAVAAQAQLDALAAELDQIHPGAANSLREGLTDTLTVLELQVAPTPARTMCSTNAIESMNSICRNHARNVTRWRDGQMVLRWCAAGMTRLSSSSTGSTATNTWPACAPP
jgi:putative transposase